MLLLEQDNNAGALAVERGGGVEEGLAYDLLDLLVVDGRLLLKSVDRAASLDRREVRGRHGGELGEKYGSGVVRSLCRY